MGYSLGVVEKVLGNTVASQLPHDAKSWSPDESEMHEDECKENGDLTRLRASLQDSYSQSAVQTQIYDLLRQADKIRT